MDCCVTQLGRDGVSERGGVLFLQQWQKGHSVQCSICPKHYPWSEPWMGVPQPASITQHIKHLEAHPYLSLTSKSLQPHSPSIANVAL